MTAYAFLSPALVVFGIFVVFPNIEGIRTSLYDYNPFSQTFVGPANYVELATDPRFWGALRNTTIYAISTTTLVLVLSLATAMLLNTSIGFRSFTRVAVFIPFALSTGVVSIVFTFLLDPDIGWLTYTARHLGLPTVAVLRDPLWAMIAVIAVGVWKNVGYFAVIFLAGLQQIPRELYDAAAVDGVSPWQRFRYVTLPLLANSTMIVSVLLLIGGLQVFDQIYVMTAGGPYFSTESLVGYIFNRGFGELRMGYASAVAVVFTVIVAALSFIQIRYFNRRAVQF
jgi:multiple sugar transport system permease protein